MTNNPEAEPVEFFCDVPCGEKISLPEGVNRYDRGWGRMSLYGRDGTAGDYDLCPEHFDAVLNVLWGVHAPD